MAAPIMPSGRLVDWYLRRYAVANMNATVSVVRIDDPVVDGNDPDIAASVQVKLLYEGPGRLYKVSGPGNDESMDEETAFSTSYISIPAVDKGGGYVMSQMNDFIKILGHSDPDVVGRVFRVLDVDSGGQWLAARRHLVTGAARYEGWTWVYG